MIIISSLFKNISLPDSSDVSPKFLCHSKFKLSSDFMTHRSLPPLLKVVVDPAKIKPPSLGLAIEEITSLLPNP